MKYKWEHAVQYNKRKLCDEGGWKRVVNWWIKASMSEQIVVVKTIIKQIKAQHIRRRMKRNKNYVYKMNGQRQEDKCAIYSGHCMRKCVVCVCVWSWDRKPTVSHENEANSIVFFGSCSRVGQWEHHNSMKRKYISLHFWYSFEHLCTMYLAPFIVHHIMWLPKFVQSHVVALFLYPCGSAF